MTKIRLVDGTIVNASSVELVAGVLKITTLDSTVEELAGVFSDEENIALLVFMTESGIETGYRTGFTSFAGIDYDAAGNKTIKLFQPMDLTEARVATAEGTAYMAMQETTELGEVIDTLLGEEVAADEE